MAPVAAKLDTIRRYYRAMPLSSLWHYARWRRDRRGRETTRVRLRNGLRLLVRPDSSDVWIASELFVRGQYDPPPPIVLDRLRTVVDVGANVGYASLLFLERFPEARVTAFEPLPGHVRQIREHLRLNGYEERAALVPAAAGTQEGEMYFREAGAASALESEGTGGKDILRVPVADWFSHLPEGTIDLLKMDIEGAEFALLNDPRFPEVAKRTHVMVLEWHNTDEYPRARDWCRRRLEETGFRVLDGDIDYGHAGLLWASRQ